MKKLFLSLVASIACATTALAQDVYVATLNHEGTITEYYGKDGLSNALKVAVANDVITLSPGVFTAENGIGSGITVRGAGIYDDGSGTTSISSYVGLGGKGMKIEGVIFLGNLRYVQPSEGEFVRCKITSLQPWDTSSSSTNKITDCTFTNCIIQSIRMNNNSSGLSFYNCHIPTGPSLRQSTIFNSLVHYSSGLENCDLTNCIVIGTSGSRLPATNKVFNCVGINSGGGVSNIFESIPTPMNCSSGNTTIFKSYTDAINNNNVASASYELSEEGKLLLGADGTEVGMLGGNYPYTPIVNIPRITKCEIAGRATADGKLSVNIEVTTPAGE